MTANPGRRDQRGFTLLEGVFAALVLSLLARYAVARLWTPAAMTLETQAVALSDLVRSAQSLAMTRRQRHSAGVAVAGANGRFTIACTGGTGCSTDTSLGFEQGVVLGGPTTVYFNSWGVPVNSSGTALTQPVNFTVAYGSDTYTVSIAALSGRVTVSR